MLRSMGFSENDLGDGRTGIIMSDLAVNYKAEGFLFDDIAIDTHIGEMQSSSFRIFHRISPGTPHALPLLKRESSSSTIPIIR